MFGRAKLDTVQGDRRSFIIFTKHRRLQRLWQFFFTGWGLVMVAALVAGSLFTKQLLWTPITTDTNGEPFKIRAASGRQEYGKPDIIFLESVSGTVVRKSGDTKITDNIRAKTGKYNRRNKTVTLMGNVRIDSSNGDKILTDELVVKL